MSWVKRFIKAIFCKCKHNFKHYRNIHGDEINQLNRKRSEWICVECGISQFRDDLYFGQEQQDKLKESFFNGEHWKEKTKESVKK